MARQFGPLILSQCKKNQAFPGAKMGEALIVKQDKQLKIFPTTGT
jgi:hypothetical protein